MNKTILSFLIVFFLLALPIFAKPDMIAIINPNAKFYCGNIYGGTDTNFCVDSTGGAGGGITQLDANMGIILTPNPIVEIGTIGFNTTWGDLRWNITFNSTYNLFAYNQTTPAINWVQNQNYLTTFTESDPLWSGNYSIFNNSWSSTYNSSYMTNTYNTTYNTWAYNQTTPAISWVQAQSYQTGTELFNTSAEMMSAINNSGYYNITSQVCYYVNNATERNSFISTFNTTYDLKPSNTYNATYDAKEMANVSSYTCSGTDKVSAINNQTGVVTCSADVSGGGGYTGANVSTTTCSGTDKISAINNQTGVVTCTQDYTGAGSGTVFAKYNYTTATLSTTSTTAYTNVLTLTLASSGRSIIECILFTNTSATTVGVQFNSSFNGGSSDQSHYILAQTTATAMFQCGGITASITCLPTAGILHSSSRIYASSTRSDAGTYTIDFKAEATGTVQVLKNSWCRAVETT